MTKLLNEELDSIYQEMRDLPGDGLSTTTAIDRISQCVKVLAWHIDIIRRQMPKDD